MFQCFWFLFLCILFIYCLLLTILFVHFYACTSSTFLFVHFYYAFLLHFYCFLLTQILDLGLKEGPLNHFILLCGGMLRVKTLPKPQTRMLFRRTLYQNVPVLILLKINDMGPYGIHLTKWHLISRHHGEIYTTRSVQSRPPQFQQPQDRTEHRTHHVDFLTLGSMCLLIFIISTLTFRSRSC